MENVDIFDLTTGSYRGITEANREKYRVKVTDDLLKVQTFKHEYLNPGQMYILFMDYDDEKLNLTECVKLIMDHLRAHGIPATESMIKMAVKSNGEKKYHFAIPSLNATIEEQKIFWQGLGFKYDSSVFRKGWFRLPNQKKPKTINKEVSESVYQPLGDAELNDFILGNIPSYSTHISTYKPKVEEFQPVLQKLTRSESFDSLGVCSSSSSLEGGFYEHSDETKVKILVHLLSNIEPDYYNDYDKWMRIGTILKGAFDSEVGFDLFIWFSKKSQKYPGSRFVAQHWKNWNEEKVTFGSFKWMVGPEIWKQALALGKIIFTFQEK